MTNISTLTKVAQKFVSDNAPTILTSFAVAGVLSTTILAVRATPQAIRDIWDAESETTEELETIEKIRLSWKHYVPSAVMGSATIACIIGANTVSSRRNAALISAYSLADTALKEYQAKVVETIGENKESKVRDEVAKQRIEENPVGQNEVYITGTGENLCYDSVSGRYFKSDIETIRKAQNDINAEVINGMYAAQNDFYRAIGLSPTALGEELGWRTDHLMDVSFSSHLSDDGRPCLSLDYRVLPIRGYWKAY